MPNHPRPILFVAFANDLTNPARNLSGLEREFVSIEAAFATVAGEDRPYVLLPNRKCTAEGLVEPFYTNQVTVFHYAGHAGPEAFELETDAGGNAAASREGLQKFLTRQERLRLIFLNACSTRKWAEELAAAGGCCVVATSRAIPDAIAPKIAHAFYANLASGCTIQEAFDKGATGSGAQFETALRDFGDLHTAEPGADHATDGLPWALYGSEWVRQWRLCDGTDDPLLGLPALDENKYRLPTSPYVDLEGHKEEHARIFFGRNGEIRQLYDWAMQPTAHPILLFYGQSGAGKSSLLRAGLLPRLGDCAKVVRRGTDLKEDLEHAIEARAGDVAGWMGAGATSLIVLDQVEEAITLGKREEMAHFVARLQEIFAERAPESKARLILSFRKEYLAEIANLLEQALPGVATELFLERLDKESIERVVLGPVRSQAAREKYRLRAGAAFARFVADTLDDGRGPVATVLQIVLRRMWEEARQRVGGNEAAEIEYSEELYREVIGKQPLQQFLDEQMKWLRENGWSAEVDGGLELDLLREHTTEFVTSRPRAREELNAAYAKKTRDLALLLEHNKKLHLLTEPADDGKPAGTTVLAHDTLARVVRQEWELSQSAGARARRILENRARSWEGKQGDLLDKADLRTVERGRGQMRAMTPVEERVFHASRARLRRQRQQLVTWGSVTALLIAVIFTFALVHRRAWDGIASRNQRAVNLLGNDDFEALLLAMQNGVDTRQSWLLRVLPDRKLPITVRATLLQALLTYHENGRYRFDYYKFWERDVGACATAFDQSGRLEFRTLFSYEPLQYSPMKIEFRGREVPADLAIGFPTTCDPATGLVASLFVNMGQSAVLATWKDGAEQSVNLGWNVNYILPVGVAVGHRGAIFWSGNQTMTVDADLASGRTEEGDPGVGVPATVAFSPDERVLVAAGSKGIHWIDPESGKTLLQCPGNYSLLRFGRAGAQNFAVVVHGPGEEPRAIEFWKLPMGEKNLGAARCQPTVVWPVVIQNVTALAVSPDGTRFAIGDEDGDVNLYPMPRVLLDAAPAKGAAAVFPEPLARNLPSMPEAREHPVEGAVHYLGLSGSTPEYATQQNKDPLIRVWPVNADPIHATIEALATKNALSTDDMLLIGCKELRTYLTEDDNFRVNPADHEGISLSTLEAGCTKVPALESPAAKQSPTAGAPRK